MLCALVAVSLLSAVWSELFRSHRLAQFFSAPWTLTSLGTLALSDGQELEAFKDYGRKGVGSSKTFIPGTFPFSLWHAGLLPTN